MLWLEVTTTWKAVLKGHSTRSVGNHWAKWTVFSSTHQLTDNQAVHFLAIIQRAAMNTIAS